MANKLAAGLKHDHLWLSPVLSPCEGPLDRSARITICFTCLCATLTAVCLFYSTATAVSSSDSAGGGGGGGAVGILHVRPVVAILSAALVFPSTTIFTFVFRKAGVIGQEQEEAKERAVARAEASLSAAGGLAATVAKAAAARAAARGSGEGEGFDESAEETAGVLDRMFEADATAVSDATAAAAAAAYSNMPYKAITYAGAHLFCLFCTFIIVLYGIKFRSATGQDWLFVGGLAVMQDLIVHEPAKLVMRTAKMLASY